MAASGELNLIASFPSPFLPPGNENDATAKAAAVKAKISTIEPRDLGIWEPDIDDFTAIVNAGRGSKPVEINGILQMLAVILTQEGGPFRFVNIFGHANPEQVALRGTIRLGKGNTPGSTQVLFGEEPDAILTVDSMERVAKAPPSQIRKSGRIIKLPDVQRRLKEATVVLYACHSGVTKGGFPARVFLGGASRIPRRIGDRVY